MSYYHRCVKGFAAITSPLHTLTKKVAVCHRALECQKAFVQLKYLLTTASTTAFPDFDLPFQLYTNASTLGFGAILVQVQEEQEQIICCTSHALLQREINYPATKLECLVIVWATANLHPYLKANKFTVYTDHYALLRLRSIRTGSALLHRWFAALEEFDYTVHHQPGKNETHVNGLCWLPMEQALPEGGEATLVIQPLADGKATRWAV